MTTDRAVFRAPKGTRDVLPPESGRWQEVVTRFADRAARFGYGMIMTPIFEHYEVFARIGTTTDVVSKEMYDFVDKGERRLALRPEGTAGVVRSYVEHRPVATPWKTWYVAPNFRYERPQEGRYRQHWQLGAEAIGSDDTDVDVEMIDLLAGFYRSLGLQHVKLCINSMGDPASRAAYRDVLLNYWRDHRELLAGEMERAEANPLRILDSKTPAWQPMIDAAPQLGDYLNEESTEQFASVRRGLTAIGIDYEIAPRLVRGFDYYTATVFEFQGMALGGAQNALGGGGRYDRLSEEMGGPPAPAIGFGSGIERLLLACDAEAVIPVATSRADVFVVDALDNGDAAVLLHELREAGLRADRSFGTRAVKKQWAAANKAGARFAIMLAEREAAAGVVAIKDLASGEQREVARGDIANVVHTQINAIQPTATTLSTKGTSS